MSERATATRGPATTGPGDAVERDADRRARAALDARVPGMCSACAVGRPCTRKGHGGGEHGRLVPGGGRALPDADRADFEARFGTDLSDVRIHDGDAAARSARSVGARAFTTGADIVFGAGAFAPSTAGGRELLAHELAHVVQGGGGPLRRKPVLPPGLDGTPAPELEWDPNHGPKGGWVVGPVEPVDPSPPANVPNLAICDVDPTALTNEELVKQRAEADAYMNANLGVNDFYLYRDLQKKLVEEIRTRILNGDAWLADGAASMPSELFVISATDMGLQVFPEDASLATGFSAPKDDPLLTRGQVIAFARLSGIKQDAIEAALSSGEPVLVEPDLTPEPEPQPASFDATFNPLMGGTSMVGVDPRLQQVLRNTFRTTPDLGYGLQGLLGENVFNYTDPFGSPNVDLNSVKKNFPNYDFFNPQAKALIQVKTTTQPAGRAWGSESHYHGFMEMAGEPHNQVVDSRFQKALGALEKAGFSVSEVEALQNGYLAINEDHVVHVRKEVRAMLTDPKKYQLFSFLFDAHLAQAPINGHKDWVSVPLAEEAAVAAELAGRIERRVIGNGLNTEQVKALVEMRSKFKTVSNNDFAAGVSPELIDAAMLGGNKSAMRAAAMRSAAIGGGVSVLGSFGLEGYDALRHNREFDVGKAVRQSMLGTAAGVGTGAAEYAGGIYASNRALALLGKGQSTWLTGARGKVIGGTAATIFLAPVISSIELGLDQNRHPWQRYVARGVRATSSAAAGALAGAALGAMIGGPWGFVAGLAAGFVGGLAFDAVAGDAIEGAMMNALPVPKGCP